MKHLIILALTLCSLLCMAPANAVQRNLVAKQIQEQKRVALVIGNANYQGAPALRNPVNDARAISQTLTELGFQVVEVTDASQREINLAITAFGRKLDGDTIALFFYAGHGLQVKGRNYIIPVDARIDSEPSVSSEGVSVDTILEQLNVSPISIVILDACRNNPYERSFRKIGGGLAQMDAPKGSFIAYATAPGKTAADGDGKNGLFTQELLKQIQIPGLSLESVFKRVRANVAKRSGDTQMPWDSSSMTGDFYFIPGNGTTTVVTSKTHEQIEDEYWEKIKDSNDPANFERYRRAYPEGRYLSIANLKLAQLKKQTSHLPQPVKTGNMQSGSNTSVIQSIVVSGQVTSAAAAMPLAVGGVVSGTIISGQTGNTSVQAAPLPIGVPLEITDEVLTITPVDNSPKPVQTKP